jgi:UDPglucose 6-dehydrogenase
MEALWKAGAMIRAYDPEARAETRRIYGERPDLVLCDSPRDTLDGADALVVVTEWNQFRSPDFEHIRDSLNEPVIFDGRNLYDPVELERLGFTYYSIGRPPVID